MMDKMRERKRDRVLKQTVYYPNGQQPKKDTFKFGEDISQMESPALRRVSSRFRGVQRTLSTSYVRVR